ncbi:MAG: hypothetical protein IJ489_10950 [Clostridia bacterium]|nr:hypothetical protein [Clostridia bacterium]
MLYQNEYLNEISFPLGGIGTGCIGLAGNGTLIDWEIFNRPNKGSINAYSFFAVRAEFPDGKSITKILKGDHTKYLTGQFSTEKFGGFGFGPDAGTMCGFPHFQNIVFDGRFPIATLTFTDSGFPAEVIMTAYNPLIPGDADRSGIPAAFFDIRIKSHADNVRYTVIFSVRNPFAETQNKENSKDSVTAITLKYAGKDPNDKEYGDLTVATTAKNPIVQEYWYRGGWKDPVATFWHELTSGTFHPRVYDMPAKNDICSVGGTEMVGAGKTECFSFVLAWNVPNNYNSWDTYLDKNGKDVLWKNYYATKFADSLASARYALENREELYRKTEMFRDSLHGSTLDPAVIDAVSSTLSVLKSPTVLRLEDGTFYGWEGVRQDAGSCEGTCTHVWSYAYALCFLFPDLERSIRNTEFCYDTDEDGKMSFRTKLPLGRGKSPFRACLDGQMASVFKSYREWKLSENDEWLKENWNTIKSLIDYAWSEKNPDEWDLDRDGVLEGRQHHTLDMEMFGPSAWLEGMYLAALKAAQRMAMAVGDTDAAKKYGELFEKGFIWTKNNLFNGEYFIHKVDIRDKSYTEHFDCPNYWNDEKEELKYQIAEGCSIDQLLGQWHANILGLGDIFDKEQRKIAIRNMFRYIFKESLRDFPNAWRVFALEDEGGAVMCAYPENVNRPIIPIPYSDECMTGFEYAFAGLLISEGMTEEGLAVIRAIRNRYDGKKRNPWNEIECGSNYARAMASFALLPIFSGFRFDLPKGYIGFAPITEGDFRCLWSASGAWGDMLRQKDGFTLTVNGGNIQLSSVSLASIGKVRSLTIDGKETDFTQDGDMLYFKKTAVTEKLTVTYKCMESHQ